MKIRVPILLLIAFASLSPALAQSANSAKDQNMVQTAPGYVNHPALSKKNEVQYEKLSNIPFESSQNSPFVEYVTEKGAIVCRDPQAEFDETALRTSPLRKLMKEHMLVDILINKRLLHKDKAYVDSLLGFRQDQPEASHYDMIGPRGRVCGNAPNLVLETVYDKDSKVARYRSRYFPNVSTPSVDSQWIE